MHITKKQRSRFNRTRRGLNKVFNPRRQEAKDSKKKATEELLNLLGGGQEAITSNFPYTQQAMALIRKTYSKSGAIISLNPVACIQQHMIAHTNKKRLTKAQEKLNQENTKTPRRAILSVLQIDEAVKAFGKNLSRHYNIESTKIIELCEQLKENLMEESKILYNSVREKSKIYSETTELS